MQKSNASRQLRRVYLQLALKYHPDRWPDVNKKEATQLFQAIGKVYSDLLSPQGRAFEKKVKSPVAVAAELGDLEELRRILTERPSRANEPDENEMFPVMFAAKGGSLEAVQILLDFGADIYVRTPLDWSVLLFAALGDYAQMVSWMIDSKGLTATEHEIILTTYTGNPNALETLLKHFAGNAADIRTERTGKTLLFLACEGMCHLKRDRAQKYLDSVSLLLKWGVPVEAVEPKRGRTCLLNFVADGEWEDQGFDDSDHHLAVVSLLCKYGASTTRLDSEGNSALALARSRKLSRLTEVLSSFPSENGTSRL
eukprot:gnl/MRDRNA2_/MRDRNA2_67687_c0_seq1.p1 gnl/MRDRNA2_/MRDRNA2_67687_c0~~gnl/MRDRNA2_/MRDRNA2_67687_c0_seq1.p1  ORF type:complete len:312 (+),score=41.96 gnl/MRDRNA2_/MRDRNA2_67687_c0_seq1:45-980(+)